MYAYVHHHSNDQHLQRSRLLPMQPLYTHVANHYCNSYMELHLMVYLLMANLQLSE